MSAPVLSAAIMAYATHDGWEEMGLLLKRVDAGQVRAVTAGCAKVLVCAEMVCVPCV